MAARQSEILMLLRRDGTMRVGALAAHFDVSQQSIRKDLTALENAGLVRRVHGAVVIGGGEEYSRYSDRRLIAQREKRAIGLQVARLVPDHATVFIKSGTTTEIVAHSLAGHTGLTVILDNVATADVVRHYQGCEVLIVGGRVRRAEGAVVGDTVAEFIRQFRVSHAVVSAAAVGSNGELLGYRLSEAPIVRAVIETAQQVIVPVDSSKFGQTAPIFLGQLAEIDLLVTDHMRDPKVAEICNREGVRYIETETHGRRRSGARAHT